MLTDLLTLRKELQSAATESERRSRDAAFRTAVEAEIRTLFDDPDFPARRRSFSVIRKRLGVFDADADALKEILFSMGARVHRGEGDTALWTLPPEETGSARPAPRPRSRWSLQKLAGVAVVVAIGLVATDMVIETLTGRSGLAFAQAWLGPTGTHADCLENADGRLLEILKCHREFGVLSPPQ